MKILGIILLSVATVTVTARHRKEWQRVDPSQLSRERLQTFYRSDVPACANGAGFYRDPQDCHQYVRCVDEFGNGRHFSVFVGRCEPGLVFDENVSACNWPELAAPCSSSPEKFQEIGKPFKQVGHDNAVYEEQKWGKPYPAGQQVVREPQVQDEQQEVPVVQEIQIAAQEPVYQDKYPQAPVETQSSEESHEQQQQVYQDKVQESDVQEQVFQENVQQPGFQEQVYQDNIQVPVSQEQDFEDVKPIRRPIQDEQQTVQQEQQQIIYQEPSYENNQNGDSRPEQVSSTGFQQVVDQEAQQFEVSDQAQQEEVSQQATQSEWWVPEDRPQHTAPQHADQVQTSGQYQGPIFCSDEGFYTHPENCSQFVRCVKIERGAYAVHFFECPKQLIFDEKDSACIVPNTHSCRFSARKKRQASGENLRCKDEGFFRHPEDCRAFYRCVKTETGSYETHLFSCPANLVFDEEYTTCNWPEKAPPCDNQVQSYKPTRKPMQTERPSYQQPSRTTNRGSGSTRKPGNDYIDKTITQVAYDSYGKRRSTGKPKVTTQSYETGPKCRSEGFFGSYSDCTKFFKCVRKGKNFVRYELACPQNFAFDDTSKRCVAQRYVASCNRNRQPYPPRQDDEETTMSPESSSTQSSNSGDEDIKCEREGYFRHPEDCNRFYRCVDFDGNGEEFVRYDFKCPEGLVFDEVNSVCNWPDESPPCDGSGNGDRGTEGESDGSENGTNENGGGNEDDGRGSENEGETGSNEDNDGRGSENENSTSQPSTEVAESTTSSSGDNNEEGGNENESSGSESENGCTKEGFYRNPDDCNKFYRCVDFNGEGKEFVRYDFNCPEGLVFDEVNSVCNWPAESEPCDTRSGGGNEGGKDQDETESTTSNVGEGESSGPSENEQSTPSDNGSPGGATDENTTPDSGSGTSEGTTESSGSTTGRSTSSPSEGNRNGESGGNQGECTEEGYFRDPEDCTKFYRCVDFNGDGQEFVKYDFECPDGLVFDEVNSVCNWPDQSAPCESGDGSGGRETTPSDGGSSTSEAESSSEPPQSSTAQSSEATQSPAESSSERSTESATEQSTSGDSSECSEPGFYRCKDDCSKFYRCVEENGQLVRYDFKCPDGLIFDDENKKCDYPSSELNCDTESTTSSAATSSEQSSTTSSYESSTTSSYESSTTEATQSSTSSSATSSSGSSNKECKEEGFFRDPDDCSKYYRCIDEGDGTFTREDFSCAEDEVFDEEMRYCNRKDLAPPCDESQTTAAESSTESGKDSECSQPGFFRCRDECHKFYRCVEEENGTLTRYDFECPEGLIFDDRNDKCDFPSEELTCDTESSTSSSSATESSTSSSSATESSTSGSQTSETTSQEPSSTTSTSGTTSSSNECTEEGFFRNPDDCSKYYRCVDEGDGTLTREDFACEEDEVFDEEMRYCNRKDLAPPCDETSSTTESSSGGSTSQTTSSESESTSSSTTSGSESTTSSTTSESESATSSTTSGSSEEESSSGTTSGSSGSGECEEEGFHRDPNDCSKFYRCVDRGDGQSFTRYDFDCPEGLVFDETNDVCNWPSSVPSCESSGGSGGSTGSESSTESGSTSSADSSTSSTRSDEQTTSSTASTRPDDQTSSTSGGGDSPTGNDESTTSASTSSEGETTSSDRSTSSGGTTSRGSGGSDNIECTEEGFFRHPEDCSKFYRCVDFAGTEESYVRYDFDCPEGLVFDEVNSVCNWPNQSPSCESGSRGSGGDSGSDGNESSSTSSDTSSESSSGPSTDTGTTSQDTSTTTRDQTTSSSSSTTSSASDDFECKEEGYFKHPTDCKKYYECKRDEDTGELVKIDCECPDGQVWDNEGWYCNAKELSPPCDSDSSSSFKCREEGFFRDPEDCTRYYQCNRTGPGENDFSSERHQCDDGLVFDESGRYCNAPELSEPCDESSTTSSGSTSDGSSSGSTSDGSSDGTTSGGTTSGGTTSSGTTSDGTTSSGTTSSGTSTGQEECTREGFFRNSEDCTKYYECSRNENTGDLDRTDHTCPDGRIFDEGSNYCNDPELSDQPCDSDSNNGTTTSSEGSTSSSSSSSDGGSSSTSAGTRSGGGNIECTEEGFFRHPDDCNKFYRCVDFSGSGESYVRYDFDCPEGLHFDEVNSVCNWPTMTPPCESGSSDSSSSSSQPAASPPPE